MDGGGRVNERTKADRRGERTRQPNNSWASEVSTTRPLRFLFTYKGVGFSAYYSLLFLREWDILLTRCLHDLDLIKIKVILRSF